MKDTSGGGGRNRAAGASASGQTRLLRGLAGVGVLGLLVCLGACGRGAGDYDKYVAPPDANAQLVVHPQYDDTFDVFLDGKLLGRISWTQTYAVGAGQHVFHAKEVRKLTSRGRSGTYTFAISPGETVHLSVVKWEEYGAGDVPGKDSPEREGIRITEIHP